LLEGQTQLETGEISEQDYAALERDVLARLGEARRRRQVDGEPAGSRVTGVEVQFTGDDDDRR
jgi:hypothetical protein